MSCRLVRVQVSHNATVSAWYLPNGMPWRTFATKWCTAENVDPDAVAWHAECRLEEDDPSGVGEYSFSVPIDPGNTIDDWGLDRWDTIFVAKKVTHAPVIMSPIVGDPAAAGSNSSSSQQQQQQPGDPAAAGISSNSQPLAFAAGDADATAKLARDLRTPSPSRAPKRGAPLLPIPFPAPKARPHANQQLDRWD